MWNQLWVRRQVVSDSFAFFLAAVDHWSRPVCLEELGTCFWRNLLAPTWRKPELLSQLLLSCPQPTLCRSRIRHLGVFYTPPAEDNPTWLLLCLCPLGLLARPSPFGRRLPVQPGPSRAIWPPLPAPKTKSSYKMTRTKVAPKSSPICRGRNFDLAQSSVLKRPHHDSIIWNISWFGTSKLEVHIDILGRAQRLQSQLEICRKIKAWNMKITAQKIQSKVVFHMAWRA